MISSISSSVTPTAPVQQRSPAHETARSTSDATAESLNEARLTAVVELIKRLTGREVKLVPPSPYLVSAPASLAPVQVDLVVEDQQERMRRSDRAEPVTVDISEVIERGTSPRMRLADGQHDSFVLRPELDLAI